MEGVAYWSLLSPVAGALAGATIVAVLNNYFGERGKNLATKHDFAQLQQQLRENTEITRSIEGAYQRADELWRSELDFRGRQLAEFYGVLLMGMYKQVKSCPTYGWINSFRRSIQK